MKQGQETARGTERESVEAAARMASRVFRCGAIFGPTVFQGPAGFRCCLRQVFED